MFDDTENQVVEETVIETPEESVPEQQVESDQAKNMRVLREKSERIEKERDEAIHRAREYESMIMAQKQQQIEPESDEIKLGDDELAEGKHLAKMAKKMRKMEEDQKKSQQQLYQAMVETTLKAEYPDLTKVITAENIDNLKNNYPDIAKTIDANPDYHSKVTTTYTLMKKLGIYVEDIYEKDRQVAQRNSAKPRPVNSISPQQGESPLTRANAFANGLTDDLQKSLYKEMIESMKNR
jgi:hypothetical protein